MSYLIHETALVSDRAKVGENVEIGPFSIIHDNVILGNNVKIGAYCEIGVPTSLAKRTELKIGEDSIIRSHSVFYIGSNIDANLVTGHFVTVRENSIIGKSCQLGNRTDIQGDCSIGDFTKMHADVHIGKKSVVGRFVWLFPEVLLTNDPTPPSNELVGITIKDFAVLSAKTLVLPGVVIGADSVIAAGSMVKDSIAEGKLAAGSPAKILCDAGILRMHNNPKLKAYPWRYRFHRGYPDYIIDMWLKEFCEQRAIR